MRKIFFVLLCLIFVFSFIFVFADDSPSVNQSQSDVENIQNDINNYVPINESGQFDPTNYKSLAEQRIEKINAWLDEHQLWFEYIFGIKGGVSWYFGAILFLFLDGFVTFILNHKRVFYLNWNFFTLRSNTLSLIFGAMTFVIFMALRIPKLFATLIFVAWVWGDAWYLPMLRFVLFVIIVLVWSYALGYWGNYRRKKAEESETEEERINREALERLVKRTTG